MAAAYKIAVAIAALLCCLLPSPASAQPVAQERLQAAMTVQLLSFVDWPGRHEEAPVVIGVFEDASQYGLFETLLQGSIYQNRYELRLIEGSAPDAAYEHLDALFIPGGEAREVARILKRLEARPIVLIGSFEGFLEMGGMVNFVKNQKRLGIEINLASAKRSHIAFRAKLLRLASRIVEQ